MAHRPLLLALCIMTLASSAARVASAQTPPKAAAPNAEATALFTQAVASFEKKRYAEALPLFEKSYQLEEALGTLLYLADCHAQLGHTATAWTTFRKAAAEASRTKDRRASAATERVKALEPSLAYWKIVPAPQGPPGQELRVDGKVVPLSEVGVATPIDPGPHTLELGAPGFRTVRRDVDVSAGSRGAVELPPLVAATATPAPTSEPTSAVAPPSALPVSAAEPPRTGPWRTVGYVAGATGLAVAGLGTYLALARTSEANDASKAREIGSRATYDEAKDGRTVGLIVAGLGGALVAAGVVTVLLHPTSSTALRVGPTPYANGLQLAGQF